MRRLQRSIGSTVSCVPWAMNKRGLPARSTGATKPGESAIT